MSDSPQPQPTAKSRADIRLALEALIAVLADIVESSCTRPRVVQSAPNAAAKPTRGVK